MLFRNRAPLPVVITSNDHKRNIIIGVVVGGICLILLAAAAFWFIRRRKTNALKKKGGNDSEVGMREAMTEGTSRNRTRNFDEEKYEGDDMDNMDDETIPLGMGADMGVDDHAQDQFPKALHPSPKGKKGLFQPPPFEQGEQGTEFYRNQ
jgi:hypothetical protein